MRVALHQQVILERAGLALVGVADDVFWLRGVLDDELPFHARRDTRAAPALQAGRGDDLDDLFRLHGKRLAQAVVAIMLKIEIQRVGVGLADEFCENRIHTPRPLPLTPYPSPLSG